MHIGRLLIIVVICLGVSIEDSHLPAMSPSLTGQEGASQQKLRTVEGQTLKSDEMPAIRLRFDKNFKYIGGQKFVLYNVALAEQHFFVDADKQGRIKRLYWVQFEGFLPDNKETYRYKVNKSVKIAGLDFITDTHARNIKASPAPPDSDGGRAGAFLEKHGYRIPGDEVIYQRLVHLIDEPKRNELMVIYMEDLSRMNLTAADFAPGGSAASRWDDISDRLLERAQKGMEVLR